MIKNWLEIDGRVFNVTVTAITESATILYSSNTGRTISKGARMTLDPLGTFFNYNVTVKRKGNDVKSYDELFDYVTRPRTDGFRIKAVHNQKTIDFDGYISGAERELSHIDNNGKTVYWKQMSLSIVAMEAQVIPS